MIQERREYLLETIEMDKEHKLRILKVLVVRAKMPTHLRNGRHITWY